MMSLNKNIMRGMMAKRASDEALFMVLLFREYQRSSITARSASISTVFSMPISVELMHTS